MTVYFAICTIVGITDLMFETIKYRYNKKALSKLSIAVVIAGSILLLIGTLGTIK